MDRSSRRSQLNQGLCWASIKQMFNSMSAIDVEKCSESTLKHAVRSFLSSIAPMSAIRADLILPSPTCVLFVDWLKDSIWGLYLSSIYP